MGYLRLTLIPKARRNSPTLASAPRALPLHFRVCQPCALNCQRPLLQKPGAAPGPPAHQARVLRPGQFHARCAHRSSPEPISPGLGWPGSTSCSANESCLAVSSFTPPTRQLFISSQSRILARHVSSGAEVSAFGHQQQGHRQIASRPPPAHRPPFPGLGGVEAGRSGPGHRQSGRHARVGARRALHASCPPWPRMA